MSSVWLAHRWVALIGCVTVSVLRVSRAAGEEFVPSPHQLDLEIANLASFVADTSLVRVREHAIEGTRFHLTRDLGIKTMQLPAVSLTYWFDELNAL
jgi:hypothetical protein